MDCNDLFRLLNIPPTKNRRKIREKRNYIYFIVEFGVEDVYNLYYNRVSSAGYC